MAPGIIISSLTPRLNIMYFETLKLINTVHHRQFFNFCKHFIFHLSTIQEIGI